MNNRILYSSILVAIGILLCLYIIKFGFYPLSNSPQNWGAFGDFIGGLSNPLISFTALVLLMRTISQNEKALDQAKKALQQNQKALKQNEKALKQNATEMIESRKELAKSAKAQREISEFEKIKQEKSIEDDIVKNLNYSSDVYQKNVEHDAKSLFLYTKSHKISFLELIELHSSEFSEFYTVNAIQRDLFEKEFLHLILSVINLTHSLSETYTPKESQRINEARRLNISKFQSMLYKYKFIFLCVKIQDTNKSQELLKDLNKDMNEYFQIFETELELLGSIISLDKGH
jgi:flagellar biosynthesis GTPase FlhF